MKQVNTDICEIESSANE